MTKSMDKKPGTLKTYLGSVMTFFDFCEINNESLLSLTNISFMRTVIKKWRRNLQRKIEERSTEKQLNDLQRLPSHEEMTIFDKSNAVSSAKQLLSMAACKPNNNITRKEYCSMRDYLISTLIMDNASRSGAIANMTLREYRQVSVSKDDGHLINVKKHKTGYKGPAILTMDNNIFKQLKIYVENVRNKLNGVNMHPDETVFVSWAGKRMDSSMVTGRLSSFWSQALEKEVNLNTTLVRKFASTTVCENMSGLQADAANLMCHSKKTQQISYHLVDKQRKAFATSQLMKKALRTDFSISESQTASFDKGELRNIFQKEIDNSEISISVVREKTETDDQLNCFKWNEKTQKSLLDSIRYIISSKKIGNCTIRNDAENSENSDAPETNEKSDDQASKGSDEQGRDDEHERDVYSKLAFFTLKPCNFIENVHKS